MYKVWSGLGLRQHRLEKLSSMWHEVDMRQARVVHEKWHGITHNSAK